jgi:hypothetical protein
VSEKHRTTELPLVPLARIHPPPLAGPVHKLPSSHDGLPAAPGVADLVVNEAEASAEVWVEGLGVVVHGGTIRPSWSRAVLESVGGTPCLRDAL